MSNLVSRTRHVVALGGWFLFLTINGLAGPTPKENPTDSVIAGKLGLSVSQIQALRTRFALNDAQLRRLSPSQLQPLLWDIAHPGIDRHAEALKFRALRLRDEHGKTAPDAHKRAQQAVRSMTGAPKAPASGPSPLSLFSGGLDTNKWTWLGPGNIGGRVRALLLNPADGNVLWCGGAAGGVWKTTNAGAAWYPLDDFMANLSVSCLAMPLGLTNIIYAGTGEGFYNEDAIRGAGIFKTTDGGTTWTQLFSTATSDFFYVNRLAADPFDTQALLAATRNGLFRTSDGGSTWYSVLTNETLFVAYHPVDGNKAVAAGFNGQAWYSLDGGLTWNPASGLPTPSGFTAGRVELAYAPGAAMNVYASVDNNNGEVYVSHDGGQSYTNQSTGYGYLGDQGWYDNSIAVEPTCASCVIVGGIDLWRSIDSGVTFTKISDWTLAPPYGTSTHADHHTIFVGGPPFGTTLWVGNDGGVSRADDVTTVTTNSGWTSLNNNLGITQFYSGAGNSNTTVIIGGTQDNGTIRYTTGGGPQGWTTMFGGDGGFCASDQVSSNFFYGEYVFLEIFRSTNTGVSASYITNGITEAGSNIVNFIAPIVLDPNNANRMYAGGLNLWRTSNVKAANPVWTSIKPATNSPISAVAVAPNNANVVWVGHNNGDIYSTANALAPTPAWTQRNFGSPLPARYCTRIAIAPGDVNRVYATFGGFFPDNVWRTSDGGTTWTNIAANLPPAPVNSIVISRLDTNTLYVGSEVGVFGTSNPGTVWSLFNDGPANVAVDELFWLGNKLIAATHGRGMFSINPFADLRLSQQAPSTVTLGDNYSYTILVSNRGPAIATSVTVTDAVPSTVTLLSVTNSQGACVTNFGIVACNLGTLDVTSNATITINVKATTPATVFNTSTARAAEPDTNLTDNAQTTAVLIPVDADGDGIDDEWELAYGFDPHDSADATLDKDGDGQSNLGEFQARTNPTNSASAFRITAIVRTNNDLRVTWMVGSGTTNALQRTAGAAGNFATNGFAPVFTITNVTGPGVVSTNYLDPGAATNVPALYYRVRLLP